jgi:predicted nucleic acid-binding protein
VTWLLYVSALVAHLVQSHEHHARVNVWWPGRTLAVCPITELGFLRVACALGSTMEDARIVLAEFLRNEAPTFIPCDRHALDSPAITSPRKTTDIYLANLATARGWYLATLDKGIVHPAADLIPEPLVEP